MSKEDASFPLPNKKANHTANLSASGAAVVGLPSKASDHQHGDRIEKPASALASFEAVLAASKGKQIVMFLDYDGTLSPIVEDPNRAVMSEERWRILLKAQDAMFVEDKVSRMKKWLRDFCKLTNDG